jgi:hypothetical protein
MPWLTARKISNHEPRVSTFPTVFESAFDKTSVQMQPEWKQYLAKIDSERADIDTLPTSFIFSTWKVTINIQTVCCSHFELRKNLIIAAAVAFEGSAIIVQALKSPGDVFL